MSLWKLGHDKDSQIKTGGGKGGGAGRESGWGTGPWAPRLLGPHSESKRLLFCFMSTLLSLDSWRDFKQINAPLGSRNALADNFRPRFD